MRCNVCGKEIESDYMDGTELLKREIPKYQKYDDIKVCKNCAEDTIITHIMEQFKPFMDNLFNMVNKMGYDYGGYNRKALVRSFLSRHRYLQAEVITFLINILRDIGSKSGDSNWEDSRNEWALSWAHKASQLIYGP